MVIISVPLGYDRQELLQRHVLELWLEAIVKVLQMHLVNLINKLTKLCLVLSIGVGDAMLHGRLVLLEHLLLKPADK